MKLSIRNVLKGKVTAVTEGLAVATVKVDVGGGNAITSVVTMDAVKKPGNQGRGRNQRPDQSH